jgi:HK97 family phage major capsid protein
MKNSQFKNRLAYLSSFLLASLMFMVIGSATGSILLASIIAIGFATGPKWSKAIPGYNFGILGTGAPLTEEEKQLNALEQKFKSSFEKFAKESHLMSADEFEKKLNILLTDHEGIKSIGDIKSEIQSLGEKIAAFKENNAQNQNITLKQALINSLNEVKEDLSLLKTKSANSVNFDVKAATTMSTANVTAVGTNGLSMILNDFEGGITPLPRTAPFFLSLFPAVGTNGNTVSWAEMKNPDGGSAMTAEGAIKSQADFDIVEAKADVEKVTAYIKVTKEALDDITSLSNEINKELITLVKLKADYQAMYGDGVSPNVNGLISEYAQAFTGGSLAGTIPLPNNFDVLVAAITEIATAEVITGEPAGFMANAIIMNPVDVAAMRLTKSTYGEYVFPITLPGTTSVLEIPVISNARMVAGDFLVMDTSKFNYRLRESINVNIGYENQDFTKNLVTVLAEMRFTVYVKSQHVKAFVEGDFASAKTLLELV